MRTASRIPGRVCRTLPVGTTIEEKLPRGNTRLWYKTAEDTWDDGVPGYLHGDKVMDEMLRDGTAEIVVVELDIQTTPVSAFDLEEDDYIVVSYGFWWCEQDVPMMTTARSQMLWRVGGWSPHGQDGTSWIILDAPEDTLRMVDRAEMNYADDVGCGATNAVIVPVTEDMEVLYVDDGQTHTEWTYDWTYEHEVVGPPE